LGSDQGHDLLVHVPDEGGNQRWHSGDASYWAAIKAAIFLSTYLMREAISDGTQGQSALALKRNQRWHLVVIREVVREVITSL